MIENARISDAHAAIDQRQARMLDFWCLSRACVRRRRGARPHCSPHQRPLAGQPTPARGVRAMWEGVNLHFAVSCVVGVSARDGGRHVCPSWPSRAMSYPIRTIATVRKLSRPRRVIPGEWWWALFDQQDEWARNVRRHQRYGQCLCGGTLFSTGGCATPDGPEGSTPGATGSVKTVSAAAGPRGR